MDPNLTQSLSIHGSKNGKEGKEMNIQKYLQEAVRRQGFYKTTLEIQAFATEIVAAEMNRTPEMDSDWLSNMKIKALDFLKLFTLGSETDSMTTDDPKESALPTNNCLSVTTAQIPAVVTKIASPEATANMNTLLETGVGGYPTAPHAKSRGSSTEQECTPSSPSVSEESSCKRKLKEPPSDPPEAKRMKAWLTNGLLTSVRTEVDVETNVEQAESEQNFDSLPMETLGAEPMHIEGIEHAVASPQDNVVRYCSRPYSPATEYDETIYSKRQKIVDVAGVDGPRVADSPSLQAVGSARPQEAITSRGAVLSLPQQVAPSSSRGATTSRPRGVDSSSPQDVGSPRRQKEGSPRSRRDGSSRLPTSSANLTDANKTDLQRFLTMATPYKTKHKIKTKEEMLAHVIRKRDHYNKTRTTSYWDLPQVKAMDDLDTESYFETQLSNNKKEIYYPSSDCAFDYEEDDVLCTPYMQKTNYKNLKRGQIVWFGFGKWRYVGYIHHLCYDLNGNITACCKEFVYEDGEQETHSWPKYEHITLFDYDFSTRVCYWRKHRHSDKYYKNIAEGILHRGTPGYYEEFLSKELFQVILANRKYHPILAHAPERLLAAWLKYAPVKIANYSFDSPYYFNTDNVFVDAIDKVPKYNKKGVHRLSYLGAYCNTMLVAHYLKDGNDWPPEFISERNPGSLLAISYESLFNKKAFYDSTPDNRKECQQKAIRLLEDHTSYFMKYRLHLIDDEEFERELAENPPHACQPLMAKPRAKKAKK